MGKNKRDPEKELFRRNVITGIVGITILVFLFVLTLFTVLNMVYGFLISLQNLIFRETLGVMIPLVAGVLFAFVVIKYFFWNDDRVDELKTIVESSKKKESED